MSLLTQLREEAARLADEAVPEVRAAIEHLGTHDSLVKVVVALIARLGEAVPGLEHPIDAPLPSSLTTPTLSDEEIAAQQAAQVQQGATVTQLPGAGAGVAPGVVQGPAPTSPAVAPPPVAAPQQPTMAQLESELAQARQQVAALQAAAQPPAAAAPSVTEPPSGGVTS